MFGSVLKKFMGSKHEREVKKIYPIVDAINGLEPKIKKMSDEKLRARTDQFREKLENGAPIDDLLIPAFATVREAAIRTLGMRHYDVQLIGGAVLHQGKIAEMKTGEGKTLVSTLPCYLNGLTGKGVHVVTVNDYLARRDAEWMGQVHGFLGLEVGVIHPGQGNASKKRAYQAAITYGQNNEFGFDYLRDNMKFSIYDYAQKPLHYAIVDEVDSILIDEARTPLIISGPGDTASEKYIKICEIIPRFRKEEHYEVDEKARTVTLTEEGNGYAQELLNRAGMLEASGSTLVQEGAYRTASPGANLYDPVNLESLHILQQSLRAHTLYKRDQHYMVKQDQILIIDEFTGRTLPGRRWSDGLHQAVEAKERVPIKDENITLATISFQNLFRLYDKLSGMTGTADTEASEFHDIYKLDTVVIPTNKPIAREDCEDLVYKTEREKFRAVAAEIEEANERGQPVLVGTTSVEKSDALSSALSRRGIKHNVLNAKQHEREAYIVAQAGQRGSVTVATNMAGRGTDIVLGGNTEMLAKLDVMANASEELKADPKALQEAIEAAQSELAAKYAGESEAIKEAGGLRVIGTERHESRRIDNQLRGRSGRQGDPGHSRFYLSLEDDLMRIFAGDRIQAMMDRLGMEEDIPIEHRWVSKAVENAQKKVEERNFDIRKHLLKYDDVMNQQRKSVYTLRRQVLTGQYRTVPTEQELEKGKTPEPIVEEVSEELRDRAKPIILKLIQVHSYPIPEGGFPPEEMDKYRDMALEVPLKDLKGTRWLPLERDIYVWFGCQLDLKKLAQGGDSAALYDHCCDAVGMSLTEQHERLLEMIDELLSMMIERACPQDKLAEDWDIDTLISAYEDQFGITATGLDGIADPQLLAEKMYKDSESVVLKKEKEFGPENFLRLFRNFCLRDIDRRWIEHLQAMDHLRDGIGLRGYGQKKPEQEYKREGYDMYVQMLQGIKSSVTRQIISVTQAREEDLQRLEEQRRKEAEKRQERMSGSHKSMSVGVEDDAAAVRAERARKRRGGRRMPAPRGMGQIEGEGAPQQVTVRREEPKVGRNDPCPCGSGKKHKKCCGRPNARGDGAAAR